MAQNNHPPLTPQEYEVYVAQLLYKVVSNKKMRYLIEPNLRFFGNIAPSTIDFLAEFDLFTYRSDGISHLYELKRRPISDYDLYKFDIQTKRTGLIKSKLEIITSKDIKKPEKILASYLGIKPSSIPLTAPRAYYVPIITNEQENNYLIYLKYHQAALHSHPGYYILLNNCWISQYSKREEIIKKVKDALKLTLPQTPNGDNRKILEFIYIKAHLLYNWLVTEETEVTTRDIINLIRGQYLIEDIEALNEATADEIDKMEETIQKKTSFKQTIEDEIGSPLQIDTNLEKEYKKGEYFSISTKPTKISNLYVVIGNDNYIKKSLTELIINIGDEFQVENVFLIHTRSKPSKSVADSVYNKLRNNNPNFNFSAPKGYLPGANDDEIDHSEFIKFIDEKADNESALLITYIPKLLALKLHINRNKWKYFFFIDRPEFILKLNPDENKSPSVFLKAFELKYS